jgi:AcrR family transcriptional regulator
MNIQLISILHTISCYNSGRSIGELTLFAPFNKFFLEKLIKKAKIIRSYQKAEIRKPEILESYYQVLIEEGFEGISINKIAKRMNIHPSLIIHYFKTKENLTIELVDLLIEKYEAPEFLKFDHIQDLEQRFQLMIDTIFSFEWSRTIDPGLHFGFYYLSFRNPKIRKAYEKMLQHFRDYLVHELELYRQVGIVKVKNTKMAADTIVTLMEGLEFHAHFLSEGQTFEKYADYTKHLVISMLKDERFSSNYGYYTKQKNSPKSLIENQRRYAHD